MKKDHLLAIIMTFWEFSSPYFIVVTSICNCFSGSAEATTVLEQDCNSPISYTKQYCMLNSTKWQCIRERGLLQDTGECPKDRVRKGRSLYCAHAEICIFSVPDSVNFKCSDRIDAKVDKCYGGGNDMNLTCAIKNVTFQTPCHRSLVHIPGDVLDPTSFESILADSRICYEEYEAVLGNQTSWALLHRKHYNGRSYDFSPVTILYWTRQDCASPTHESASQWKWLSVLPVFAILLVIALFYIRRMWKRYTYFPDPNECSDDPIAREMAKAFSAGDSITMFYSSQTTYEVVQPISANKIADPSEGGNDALCMANSAAKQALPSTSSNGSRFDASRPGGIATIVPSWSKNLYTNDAGYSEATRSRSFTVDSPFYGPLKLGSSFSSSCKSVCNNEDADGYLVPLKLQVHHDYINYAVTCDPGSETSCGIRGSETKPHVDRSALAAHDYANDAVMCGIEEETLAKHHDSGNSCGYIEKNAENDDDCLEAGDVLAVIGNAHETSSDVSELDGSHLTENGLVRTEHHLEGNCEEKYGEQQCAVGLCNPTYMYSAPDDIWAGW